MSRKSVLITLKKENLFLNMYSFNNQIIPLGFYFLKNLKSLFLKKSVLIINEKLNFANNSIYLVLDLFFETKKLKYYKKHCSFYKEKNILKHKHTVSSLLLYLSKKIRTGNIFIQFKVVNNFVDKKFMLFMFTNFKRYLSLLFVRRFNLYVDLIKVTSLYLKEKVSLNVYLGLIALVFRNLRKRSHSSFFLFFEELFNTLVSSKEPSLCSLSSPLLGIKLIINGRLKGKPRSSTILIKAGCTPSQTLSANIEYAKAHTYTNKFGVFGLKLWINRKK
jgi:hypothetical protein